MEIRDSMEALIVSEKTLANPIISLSQFFTAIESCCHIEKFDAASNFAKFGPLSSVQRQFQ